MFSYAKKKKDFSNVLCIWVLYQNHINPKLCNMPIPHLLQKKLSSGFAPVPALYQRYRVSALYDQYTTHVYLVVKLTF